jgi:hypothetical protein
MATVTGLTAARTLELLDETVVSGAVDGSGNLILTTRGGDTINAGPVGGGGGGSGPHTHPIADIVTLQTQLDDFADDLGSKAETSHTHAIDTLTGAASLEQMAPGGIFVINFVSPNWRYNNTTITARPSARSNIRMLAVGGTTPPAFALTHDMHAPEVV